MATDDLTIPVLLPRDALRPGESDVRALSEALRVLWVVEQVRCGAMSVGYGAGLVGQDRWTFVRTLGAHGVSAFGYDADEVDDDIASLRPGPPKSTGRAKATKAASS